MGLTSLLPASGNNNNQAFVAEGYVPPQGREYEPGDVAQVIGDYFRAMGIPLSARTLLSPMRTKPARSWW